MSDVPYNAAERLHVRRAAKASAVAQSLDDSVVRELMSTPLGRAWIWRKLEACHVFASSFAADDRTTSFNEGQRSIGLALISDVMRACPDYYLLAMRESDERSRAHDADRTNATRRARNGGDAADLAEPAGDAAVERED